MGWTEMVTGELERRVSLLENQVKELIEIIKEMKKERKSKG